MQEIPYPFRGKILKKVERVRKGVEKSKSRKGCASEIKIS